MSGAVHNEFVYYFDTVRWHSRFGALTTKNDDLVFASDPDIRIALRSLTKITSQTCTQLAHSGTDIAEMEFKPRTQLFLCLEFMRPSDTVVGQVDLETAVFGSSFQDEKRANRQIEAIKAGVYKARSDMMTREREGEEESLGEMDDRTGKTRRHGLLAWLRGLFQRRRSPEGDETEGREHNVPNGEQALGIDPSDLYLTGSDR